MKQRINRLENMSRLFGYRDKDVVKMITRYKPFREIDSAGYVYR